MIIFRDTSGEQRHLGEIQAENEQLSALAEASPLPQVMLCGRKLVYANAAFRKAFSWIDASSGELTLREFLGKENASVVRDLSAAETADAELSGEFHEQIALKRPDGERREFALSASRTAWNGKEAWYITLSDVTDRRYRA